MLCIDYVKKFIRSYEYEEKIYRELIFYSMWWPKLNCILCWCDSNEQKYSIFTCDNRKVMIWENKYEIFS
jgi:hypothetical protein